MTFYVGMTASLAKRSGPGFYTGVSGPRVASHLLEPLSTGPLSYAGRVHLRITYTLALQLVHLLSGHLGHFSFGHPLQALEATVPRLASYQPFTVTDHVIDASSDAIKC